MTALRKYETLKQPFTFVGEKRSNLYTLQKQLLLYNLRGFYFCSPAAHEDIFIELSETRIVKLLLTVGVVNIAFLCPLEQSLFLFLNSILQI